MRGFSMVLVVLGHVLLSMGFPTTSTVLGSILISFRIPLFFFVSGFFAFRLAEKWVPSFIKNVVKRKIQAQVICTLVFFILYQLCHSQWPFEFLEEGFSWFWFTITLFQMFIIYLILASSEYYLDIKHIVTIGLILLSVTFFVVHVKSAEVNFRIWRVLEWYYLTEYFQFFAVGILARKYYPKFQKALFQEGIRAWAIIVYVSSLVLLYAFDGEFKQINSTIYNLFEMIIVRYSGLLVVFIAFFTSRYYFESDARPCRWMRYVGRRTLDIYMLHVFLLPNLLFLKPFLSGENMLLSQLTIAMTGTVVNIAVCLILSRILHTSDFLSQWLFGEKKKVPAPAAPNPVFP